MSGEKNRSLQEEFQLTNRVYVSESGEKYITLKEDVNLTHLISFSNWLLPKAT